jgi:uncharacterized protein YbjQ (UPF0145 family)
LPNCIKCDEEVSFFEISHGLCASCLSTHGDPITAQKAKLAVVLAAIILTTESASSLPILERIEIITAEAVLGMNIFQDIGSSVRDLVGGRNQTYQVQLREARKAVLAELKLQAHQLGADAVVAVDLDYSEISGGGKSMLFVVASGTAVRLAKGDLTDNPAKSVAG